ncbi:MAG TPA: DUF3618 domain-containing protein [Pengzhenrongella sp.]
MTSSPTPHDLEVQLEKYRTELAATIDELTHRLNPRVRANEGFARTKKLVHDAGTSPSTTPADRNRARKTLGIGAATVLAVLAAAVATVSAVARRR